MDLSRDEKWVLHAMMLDRLGFGPTRSQPSDPCVCLLAIIQKLERDRTEFSPIEIDRIRDTCRRYSRRESIPVMDQKVAVNIADRIDRRGPSPPSVSVELD